MINNNDNWSAAHEVHARAARLWVSVSPANVTSYEPPCLTPIGNLRDLLGKTGSSTDFTYRRANSGRP